MVASLLIGVKVSGWLRRMRGGREWEWLDAV